MALGVATAQDHYRSMHLALAQHLRLNGLEQEVSL
jgi:hypothetical protein